jgi:hypothetical protein
MTIQPPEPGQEDSTAATWAMRAERLLEQALQETRDGIDAIPTVDAALTALHVEAGELPTDEMDDYPFAGEETDDCTCPPELRARGGFRGGCPVHNPRSE